MLVTFSQHVAQVVSAKIISSTRTVSRIQTDVFRASLTAGKDVVRSRRTFEYGHLLEKTGSDTDEAGVDAADLFDTSQQTPAGLAVRSWRASGSKW